ncbi:hypothetical protein MKI84_16250 [Ancylobacter sp. A5.8]|uniref:hypothetical protein n=1 Tax=Ancylobacter gelatini TaxID=2919920 RepID=UPI001F4DA34A|nr:hypothetical protein [Ancylobacter gelatini]MCJ8144477.1 hypothetical protein [Ancylobacter gelatini]
MFDPDELESARLPRSETPRGFWLAELPHLAILALTVAGVGYVSLTRQPIATYWALLAVIICGIGIAIGWPRARANGRGWRLVWTQALHWAAFLIAMSLVFAPSVQAIANADITSLIVLILVALGTFVSGVHTASWRMCANGVVMALAVPTIAWLDQSALVMALCAALVTGIGVLVLIRYFRA